ncbi:hypothetical protein EIP86_011423 [Pleurotus ostreatoroseus]|nr:hypothetical protein EIP86_011423 [Pleurotus ostreatoroseus]
MSSVLVPALRLRRCAIPAVYHRAASTAAAKRASPSHQSVTSTPPSAPTPTPEPDKPEQKSWLTRLVQRNPTAKRALLGLMSFMGYNSPKQIAGRRAYFMYESVCAVKAGEEKDFWQKDCHLPPTFQSWFLVTNLHVWLLTVRLRALPNPWGKHYIQGLIDHFFLDVEDRIRLALQPKVRILPRVPPPAVTYGGETLPANVVPFYALPSREGLPKGNAPERLVSRQMKIMREQWAGMGMSFDLGLVRGDAEMAAAVWRNLLGARGARGIVYPSSPLAGSPEKPYFRRSINLVGGEVESIKKLDKDGALEAEESKDDGSGVHDFAPTEAGLYVQYPELMADIVAYCRRELVRLDSIPDEVVMGKAGEDVDMLRFGRVRG